MRSIQVHFADMTPIAIKGRDSPVLTYRALARRRPSELFQRIFDLAAVKLGGHEAAAAAAESGALDMLISAGAECTPAHVSEACLGLSPGNGRPRLGPASGPAAAGIPPHAQMALRVVSWLAADCGGPVSAALAAHVYDRGFPQAQAPFTVAADSLLRRGLVRPADPEMARVESCNDNRSSVGESNLEDGSVPWAWAGNVLGRQVRRLLLGLAESGAGPPVLAAQSLPAAAMQKRSNGHVAVQLPPLIEVVNSCLATSLADGLLRAHLSRWHRLAAEYFEQTLGERRCEPAASLVLAHHWSQAAAHASIRPEPSVAAVAADHLRRAARAALGQSAPRAALALVRQAKRLLDAADDAYSGGDCVPVDRLGRLRAGLLLMAGPAAMLIYGPGSAEAVAAYSALAVLIPSAGPLDTRAAAALAGACANVCAAGQLDAGEKVQVCNRNIILVKRH